MSKAHLWFRCMALRSTMIFVRSLQRMIFVSLTRWCAWVTESHEMKLIQTSCVPIHERYEQFLCISRLMYVFQMSTAAFSHLIPWETLLWAILCRYKPFVSELYCILYILYSYRGPVLLLFVLFMSCAYRFYIAISIWFPTLIHSVALSLSTDRLLSVTIFDSRDMGYRAFEYVTVTIL